MKNIVLSIAAASALISASAFAADQAPVQQDRGFYVTGSIGGGSSKDEIGSLASVSRGGFAWNAGAGYQFNKYVALEANYYWLPEINLKDGFGDSLDTHTNVIDVAVKGILPIVNNFDIFGKAGLGVGFMSREAKGGPFVHSFSDDASVVGVFGGGAEYWVTHNVSVNAQVSYSTGNDSDNWNNEANVSSAVLGLAGVTYRF